MARQSVSKHLVLLEAANLVTTLWRGREKLHYLNAGPIIDISERWMNQYDRHRVRALSDLKRALGDTPMQKPSFVYTSYIETTPEQLWHALPEPAFTERYWRTTFQTDWKEGSTMTWENHGVTIADSAQVVLECDPQAGCPSPGGPSPRNWPRSSVGVMSGATNSPASVAQR